MDICKLCMQLLPYTLVECYALCVCGWKRQSQFRLPRAVPGLHGPHMQVYSYTWGQIHRRIEIPCQLYDYMGSLHSPIMLLYMVHVHVYTHYASFVDIKLYSKCENAVSGHSWPDQYPLLCSHTLLIPYMESVVSQD